jgi:hypothetical protein
VWWERADACSPSGLDRLARLDRHAYLQVGLGPGRFRFQDQCIVYLSKAAGDSERPSKLAVAESLVAQRFSSSANAGQLRSRSTRQTAGSSLAGKADTAGEAEKSPAKMQREPVAPTSSRADWSPIGHRIPGSTSPGPPGPTLARPRSGGRGRERRWPGHDGATPQPHRAAASIAETLE